MLILSVRSTVECVSKFANTNSVNSIVEQKSIELAEANSKVIAVYRKTRENMQFFWKIINKVRKSLEKP